jgi:hypothetical protein
VSVEVELNLDEDDNGEIQSMVDNAKVMEIKYRQQKLKEDPFAYLGRLQNQKQLQNKHRLIHGGTFKRGKKKRKKR